MKDWLPANVLARFARRFVPHSLSVLKNPRQYPVHTSLLTYCVLDLIVNGSNMDLRVSGDFFRMNLTIIVNQTLSYYLLNYEPSVK